jgi:hypothetical protein
LLDWQRALDFAPNPSSACSVIPVLCCQFLCRALIPCCLLTLLIFVFACLQAEKEREQAVDARKRVGRPQLAQLAHPCPVFISG